MIEYLTDPAEIAKLGKLTDHPLFNNFAKRVDNYVCYMVWYVDGDPMAMSGIWRADWWAEGLYRVGDRSYYFPKMRERSLAYPSQKAILSQELLPAQVELVSSIDGLPFVSMRKNKNALIRGANMHNAVSDMKLKVLDETYTVCKGSCERCDQWIAVLEEHEECFNDRTLRSVLR